ncbi:tetratricopeptide repeat protein [Rubinisphaera sp. JC750]|uniref:tetratricopeptide repeat protein n=1 Tax=Rubinisphaera sp. JC750 TaxID=2898658 RepID=UPI001F35E292|nr:hypothetical protein [Rubinisphaera sp. JC750]
MSTDRPFSTLEMRSEIIERWPTGKTDRPSEELCKLVTEFLERFPCSPALWVTAGDLMGLEGEFPSLSLSREECYQKALELDPLCGEAYEALGYLYDLDDNYEQAELKFRAAIDCTGGPDSFIGLARTLASQDKLREARAILTEAKTGFESIVAEIVNEAAGLE